METAFDAVQGVFAGNNRPKYSKLDIAFVRQIVTTMNDDQKQAAGKLTAEKTRLESRPTAIRNRMDAAYIDKLNGKIPEEVWERKIAEGRVEEQQVKLVLDGLAMADFRDRALDAQRVLELANKAYSLYVSQDSFEKAKLLRILCSNFSADTVSAAPTYRYPIGLTSKGPKWKNGRDD